MNDEFVNQIYTYPRRRQTSNKEEKCEEEEEGNFTEEFEAQASMFLPSLYLRL